MHKLHNNIYNVDTRVSNINRKINLTLMFEFDINWRDNGVSNEFYHFVFNKLSMLCSLIRLVDKLKLMCSGSLQNK